MESPHIKEPAEFVEDMVETEFAGLDCNINLAGVGNVGFGHRSDLGLLDMDYCLGIAIEGHELDDIGFCTREYMHYCADVPCLQSFFVYIVCQNDSIMFLECHLNHLGG